MQKKETYACDDVLMRFYTDLIKAANSRNPERYIHRVHIPVSDVFYVRKAIHESTGVLYTLDHVERAMYLEGHLDAKDVFEPERVREGIG